MKKQVAHGGDTYTVLYTYTHNGEQWLALSRIDYYEGSAFCSLPARHCHATNA
jgi:hypothetical protein